ncbi:MAG: HEPN domain-containing protein [Candidatus Omnitrophica bacterium]|nr:HEPN domain-containing protein [Candidatus Omnitrophota bacterium]
MSDLKKEMLKIKVKGYFDNGDLRVDPTITALVKYHVDKARHNIETGSLLMDVSEDKESKKRLKVSADYIGYDWTISCGYYAMFHAATAALAAIGIKAQSHESLIEGLEYHFVLKEKAIESKDIEKIKSAKRLDEKYVNRMWATKSKRNTAQYKADAVIAQQDAEKIYKNAIDFVDTIESLIKGLK